MLEPGVGVFLAALRHAPLQPEEQQARELVRGLHARRAVQQSLRAHGLPVAAPRRVALRGVLADLRAERTDVPIPLKTPPTLPTQYRLLKAPQLLLEYLDYQEHQ